MKATLDELAAGIRSDPRGLKRQPGGHGIAAGEHLLEAASQHESWTSLRNGRGSLQIWLAKESYSVVPRLRNRRIPRPARRGHVGD